MLGFDRLSRGATQLGFVDILTAAILLGILLWAATLQFSVYNHPAAAVSPGAAAPRADRIKSDPSDKRLSGIALLETVRPCAS
jgi:hypothetical protein